jgi:hypothetical protein
LLIYVNDCFTFGTNTSLNEVIKNLNKHNFGLKICIACVVFDAL